jgi:ABC-type sugar transport system ATPase subunit
VLEVAAVETFYGESQVLLGMSLEVRAGEVVTLLGRNGMGKTTTVRTIMGIAPPRAGTVRFQGRAIQGRPDFRIAQAGLGLVPEGRQVFPNLIVRENLVATAANRYGAPDPWTLDRVYGLFPKLAERARMLGATPAARHAQVAELDAGGGPEGRRGARCARAAVGRSAPHASRQRPAPPAARRGRLGETLVRRRRSSEAQAVCHAGNRQETLTLALPTVRAAPRGRAQLLRSPPWPRAAAGFWSRHAPREGRATTTLETAANARGEPAHSPASLPGCRICARGWRGRVARP